MSERLLRQDEVEHLTGLSRTTIWRRERKGEFPARRQIGGGIVAWLSSEVNEWITTRPTLGAVETQAEK